MALARFRFPDSSPSNTPEFPQGAAVDQPLALPLSYQGSRERFYVIARATDRHSMPRRLDHRRNHTGVTATALTASEAPADRVGLDTAYRLLWLAVIFDILAFGIGFGWDRQWHATHPFEDFFSPPHLFIYSMHLCPTITLAYLAFTPDLRRWFGPTFHLRVVPFPIPGAIGLAGAGFAVVALAGVFDAIWHTTFGLDETGWSFPHSMLGWGLFVAFLGITSCRVALREWRPIGWPSALVFGYLIAATSAERF